MHGALTARWATPLVEPGAVLRHFGALPRWRTPPAGRRFLALLRRTPAQLDAVVGVIGHLERYGAVHHVLERERPCGAVAARVGKFACRKLGGQHAFQLGLYLRDALLLRHGGPLRPPR